MVSISFLCFETDIYVVIEPWWFGNLGGTEEEREKNVMRIMASYNMDDRHIRRVLVCSAPGGVMTYWKSWNYAELGVCGIEDRTYLSFCGENEVKDEKKRVYPSIMVKEIYADDFNTLELTIISNLGVFG